MHVPVSGLVFVPLIGFVVLFRWSRAEELLIYLAVFQGAAVLNTSGGFSIGLSPYFFATCLISVRIGLKWVCGHIRFRREEFAQRHLQIVSLFIGWCVVSAFLLPFLFEGIPVDSPRAGAEAVFYQALPLRWSFSNAGQAGYMVLNCLVLLALADFVVTRPPSRLLDAYTYSGVIVVLVGLYQMAADRAGLPFPSWFFNSNASWGQAYNQMIAGGWHRVSATFVEPSDAGGFLSSWLLFELVLANWGTKHRGRHWCFALSGCVVLLATTSSTGYAVVVLTFVALAARLIVGVVAKGRVSVPIALATSSLLIVGGVFLMTMKGSSLLDSVMWHKVDSSSAAFRSATVWHALEVLRDTYGLGAGLGSNRALSILAYIVSNLGLVGLAMFMWMLAHLLIRTLDTLKHPDPSSDGRVLVLACSAALLVTLLGMTLSGAEVSSPRIWVLWGMLLAAIRAHGSAARRSPRPEIYGDSDAAFHPIRLPISV
jgi:hypothetical protein